MPVNFFNKLVRCVIVVAGELFIGLGSGNYMYVAVTLARRFDILKRQIVYLLLFSMLGSESGGGCKACVVRVTANIFTNRSTGCIYSKAYWVVNWGNG